MHRKAQDLSVIRSIAELLRRDLRYFARLAGFFPRNSSEELKTYALSRMRPLIFLTGALEHFGEIRYPVKRVPYCYMRSGWPVDLPIAGYVNDYEQLGWRLVNRTLISNWALDLEGDLEIRLKPVAIWMVYRHGIATLTDYLLDMLEDDQIIRGHSVADALVWVLSKIAGGGTETYRIGLLLDGKVPASPSEWMDILDDDLFKMSEDARFNRGDVQVVVSRVIARSVKVIEAIRRSTYNFDLWMLGQAKVSRFVDASLAVCRALLPDPPMSLRAIISQFEEIKADSLAFFLGQEKLLPLNASFDLALAMREMFRAFGKEGIDRLLGERLLVPSVLAYLLSEGELGDSNLDGRWRQVSWQLAGPLCAARHIETPLKLVRSRTPNLDRVLLDGKLNEMFVNLDIDDESKRKILEKELRGEGFYKVEYDRNAVGGAIASAINRISGDDLVDQFIASKYDSDEYELDAVVSRTLSLLELFPWNSLLYLELGIALDRQGVPNIAVKHFIAAILLAPNESMHWQSLSVVLESLNRGVESSIASAMKDVLKHSREDGGFMSAASHESEVSSD